MSTFRLEMLDKMIRNAIDHNEKRLATATPNIHPNVVLKAISKKIAVIKATDIGCQ